MCFYVQSFMCIALIMGDGLYHFIKLTGITAKSLHKQSNRKLDKRGKYVLQNLFPPHFVIKA